jgi:hypothetical protein
MSMHPPDRAAESLKELLCLETIALAIKTQMRSGKGQIPSAASASRNMS